MARITSITQFTGFKKFEKSWKLGKSRNLENLENPEYLENSGHHLVKPPIIRLRSFVGHSFLFPQKLISPFSLRNELNLLSLWVQRKLIDMKKILNISLLLSFLATAFVGFAQNENWKNVSFKKFFEDRTLRVDYLRVGNHDRDTNFLIRYVEKPGQWAGSQTQLLDPINNGDYRILVTDAATGTPLYSRCYHTLFREYKDTPMAVDSIAQFEEVMLIPYPKQAVNICMQKRDKKQRFFTQNSYFFDPKHSQVEVLHGWSDMEGNGVNAKCFEPIALQKKGDVHKKSDVVIVAEGYGLSDTAKMRKDLDYFTQCLFGREPFKSHRNEFNVWGVAVPSTQSGITDPTKGIYVQSAVGSSYNTFNSDRYLMTSSLFQLHDVIAQAPYDHIIIMANCPTYGGGAIYNFYAMSAVLPMSENILPHELGHSIGGLADEYVDDELTYNSLYPLDQEPIEPNITTLIDFESKWKDLVDPSTPVPTPDCELPSAMGTCGVIGAYEGGGYVAKGIYRPMMNCMMKYYAPFCPVCTRALEAVFDLYTK